jgi:UDP-N-acetylmuramoyl-L-alanyl-D-glutamate--2,6-diaminopimelate ligase
MNLEHIIKIVQPSLVVGSTQKTIGKVSDNSKIIAPGDVFVAIRGSVNDGHTYIKSAVEQGAAVVVSERHCEFNDVCVLIVDDTRKVLGPLSLAHAGNPQHCLTLIGVTGTNGKTTVATLIYQTLTELGLKTALLGTVAKYFGDIKKSSNLTTPGSAELALDLKEAVENGCTHLVMEVSSHALDQNRVMGLSFEVGVFTNLTLDHLDYHKSMEDYAKAKKMLFDSLSADSTAIVNFDDEYGKMMVADTKATVWDLSLTTDDFKIITVDTEGILLDMDGIYIQSPLTGIFNAYNLAQTYLSVIALGFGAKDVAKILNLVSGAPGRLEKVTLDSIDGTVVIPSIYVDYAHTPNALENVLSTLKQTKAVHQQLTAIFGCGGNRDRSKRPVMAKIAENYADQCIVTSDNPRFEDPDAIIDEVCAGFSSKYPFIRITDRTEAITKSIIEANADSIILVAGKGHETYQEVQGIKYHLDDKEVCEKALQLRLNTSKIKEDN